MRADNVTQDDEQQGHAIERILCKAGELRHELGLSPQNDFGIAQLMLLMAIHGHLEKIANPARFVSVPLEFRDVKPGGIVRMERP